MSMQLVERIFHRYYPGTCNSDQRSSDTADYAILWRPGPQEHTRLPIMQLPFASFRIKNLFDSCGARTSEGLKAIKCLQKCTFGTLREATKIRLCWSFFFLLQGNFNIWSKNGSGSMPKIYVSSMICHRHTSRHGPSVIRSGHKLSKHIMCITISPCLAHSHPPCNQAGPASLFGLRHHALLEEWSPITAGCDFQMQPRPRATIFTRATGISPRRGENCSAHACFHMQETLDR